MALTAKQLPVVAITLVLGILSVIIVALRCFARYSIRGFGWDDWLILLTEIFFIPTCICVLISVYNGLGLVDDALTMQDIIATRHAFFVFQPLYILSLIFVKISVCFTLLRFTTTFPHIRRFVYGLIILIVTSGIAVFVALFFFCFPLAASWNPLTPGARCQPVETILGLGYFLSVSSLITDFSCSILPTIILWRARLNLKTKITVVGILSLAFLASSATLVRIPLVKYYDTKLNYFYRLADLALLSVLETGLGITASSASTLRPLFRRYFDSRASPNGSAGAVELGHGSEDRKEPHLKDEFITSALTEHSGDSSSVTDDNVELVELDSSNWFRSRQGSAMAAKGRSDSAGGLAISELPG